MKNHARFPRTAGLRTMGEMSEAMTRAGLDPSRIQERAEMLAKVRGAERKRKRVSFGVLVVHNVGLLTFVGSQDEDDGMEVDAEGEGWEDDSEGMDVDGEARTTPKRAKTNSGTAVAKSRQPRTNRQLSGMRDQTVRLSIPFRSQVAH